MKRQILGAVLLLLLSMPVWAQQVKVSYEYPADSLSVPLQEYFQMQGVQHLRLTIRGEFNGKRAKLQRYLAIRVYLQNVNLFLIFAFDIGRQCRDS